MQEAKGINIITQTTAERKEETKKQFEQIKPLLDKGVIYSKAIRTLENCGHSRLCRSSTWFRDLVEYGEEQGYPYLEYSGKGKK